MSTHRRYAAKLTAEGLLVPVQAPLPPGGVRYQRSRARRLDEALRRGGDLRAIARRLDVSLTVVRTHIHDRVATGRWAFEATGEESYGGHVVPTAGKLREVGE